MAYKNALAGLDHGGGKAVIIGDPATDKTPELLRAYGRFVQGLGGRYITACDVGTYVEDMDVVAEECDYVTGRSVADGGAGDSSVLTAFGVHEGMLAAAEHLLGRRRAEGPADRHRRRRQGRQAPPRATPSTTAPTSSSPTSTRPRSTGCAQHHPDVEVVADAATLVRTELDVYAPCALGGALDDEVAEVLRAAIVCGGANNQLAHDRIDNRLAERGIVYCPDYLVNAGGVIQVADERHGFSFERAKAKAAGIRDATLAVLRTAEAEGVTPSEAADRLAERRMAAVAPAERIWTGR